MKTCAGARPKPFFLLVLAICGFLVMGVILESVTDVQLFCRGSTFLTTPFNGRYRLKHDLAHSSFGRPFFGVNYTIIFNAVPKTGSRTLETAVKNLSTAKRVGKPMRCVPIPAETWQSKQNFEDFLSLKKPPLFMRGHASFPAIDRPDLLYIGIVREPVDRVISQFNFMLHGDASTNYQPVMEPERKKILDDLGVTTIDDCYYSSSTVCQSFLDNLRSTTIRIFCGMHPDCRTPSRWSLRKAIENVDRYTVVGLQSYFSDMVKILETLGPDAFGGLYEAYEFVKRNTTKKFSTSKKIVPSNRTFMLLKKDMKLEYEFYHYVEEKFFKLKKRLKI
ncbi:Heparan sulfate 2-O-sulfotransferase hst-2 [Holothuria leucospilota]|uniref:Heparan sulfate 2-O-sulfotransferase hst-2 n=1 Tax=Holothuria leucospilota TaxID=206669 RepID=A0A9Q1C2R1_HOLLE|nr:Heparan sulfate 2-O-sulfotransferase hst-2 [Holothuria leucospilota]